jgi:prepilin-type N-terminal cleavage/methylation domain-containing protein
MDGGVPRRARGFTLIEVTVALAVVLILAAVALPQVNGYLDQKRVETGAAQLAQLRDALYEPGSTNTAFRQTVGANASLLTQLTIALLNGDDDSCGGNFSNGERSNWPNGGPFLNYYIDPTAGVATAIGQFQNTLTRTPPGGGVGTLRMTSFPNVVKLEDAQNLDLLVDVTAGFNAGTVRWSPQTGTNGMVTLTYDVVIDASC